MLKDLKLPKPKKSDAKAKPEPMPDEPQYPYGLAVTLEGKTLDKFPDLKKAMAGQEFGMKAVVRVKKVKTVDTTTTDEWEKSSVELQIVKADFDQDKQLDDAFDEE